MTTLALTEVQFDQSIYPRGCLCVSVGASSTCGNTPISGVT